MDTVSKKEQQPCTIAGVGHTCLHDTPETIHLSFFTREDMKVICKMLDRNGNGANREKYTSQINKVESFVNTKLYRSDWDWRS